jgi:hypothetical protein
MARNNSSTYGSMAGDARPAAGLALPIDPAEVFRIQLTVQAVEAYLKLNGVPRNVFDLRSPANVNTPRSCPRGVACTDRRNRPRADGLNSGLLLSAADRFLENRGCP